MTLEIASAATVEAPPVGSAAITPNPTAAPIAPAPAHLATLIIAELI
ncbi:hypothetical protein [Apilactobacillus ozensis]|nr:hypothetical protein [Apilactobacillus ozensis]